MKFFKAYDIRGKVPSELNECFAEQLGRAYAVEFTPNVVVVGHDIRLSSLSLHQALIKGLLDMGVNVISLGLCGTEEVNYQTSALHADGGIMITASHNPMDYNGMKLCLKDSVPLSEATGLLKLRDRIIHQKLGTTHPQKGQLTKFIEKTDYIHHLLQYINVQKLKPLRVVVNSGNGCAAPIIDLLEQYLPCELIKIHHEPDGSFPNGIPNPLLPDHRADTSKAVQVYGADLGVAWDGDCDRCFFFDHEGHFIDSYYMIGLIAKQMLAESKNQSIVTDGRLVWNTKQQVKAAGGRLVISKGGHSFMKQSMREFNAIYGGELSGHHYFRDFYYCDSGMIPWLLVIALLSSSDLKLKDYVEESIHQFPCSEEMNFKVNHVEDVIHQIDLQLGQKAIQRNTLDGLTLEFIDWRLNVRSSNTEPLLRLNIECKYSQDLLASKVDLLLSIIEPFKI
ncbi:phosphomannomutase/phosphoglucomutase [Wohlfahrtiimonas larvae]|uniref:phosphomannomutase n=1 Tax=Wohlfahrtiimonas larvae TaxID=1157986 RepID=A0ABP9MMB6_9GAMM|nr:phosphomannomutase/phosphoglucomutase [Wohlfahrtiimonas larvae]